MTSFYLNDPKGKKTTLMIRVHAFGFKARRSLQISVMPGSFDKKKRRLKPVNIEYIKVNQFLESLTSKSNNLILDYQLKRYKPTENEFMAELFKEDKIENQKDFWTLYDEFMEDKKKFITYNSFKVYKSAYRILKEYHPRLVALDNDIIASVTKSLILDKYSPNVIIKMIGIWTKLAEGMGITLVNKVKVRGMKSDKIHLDISELKKIQEVKLPSDSLMAIRDLFIFSCFTGLRYSDIMEFKPSFIQDIEGVQCIVFFAKKTGTKSVIPIMPVIQDILDRYNGLPRRVAANNFNERIKTICKLAGINQDIQLTKLEGDKKRSYTLKKYEAVSAHTGRRSFITNLSIMGLTTKQISLMVGHTQQRITDIYDKTKAESNAVLVAGILKGM